MGVKTLYFFRLPLTVQKLELKKAPSEFSFFLQRKFCLQDPCFDFVCPCLFSSTPMVTLFLWFRQRLLRALEARRVMLQKEQGMAFARAFAAGFSLENIGDLVLFSECFGAARLR